MFPLCGDGVVLHSGLSGLRNIWTHMAKSCLVTVNLRKYMYENGFTFMSSVKVNAFIYIPLP